MRRLPSYQHDFSALPLAKLGIIGLESIDYKLSVLNTLITKCIDCHAPLRRVKGTRPPAPWMHSKEIRALQAERNQLRAKARNDNTQDSWTSFRAVRNKIKAAVINQTRRAFLSRVLSSKRPREVRKVIHRVLNPRPTERR